MSLKERLMLMCLNSQQEAKQQWARINMKQVALAAVLVFGAQAAMAAGGFDQANKIVENIRDGIYTIVGIVCTVLLIWQMVQGASRKKDWMDVLGTCLWILGAGAAIAFGTYLFTEGGKMKFS